MSMRVRAAATRPDRDKWADSHWLHVFALRQKAVPRGPDLHAAKGNAPSKRSAGVASSKPTCDTFQAGGGWGGGEVTQAVVWERNGKVQIALFWNR